jgi:hypothetical protein
VSGRQVSACCLLYELNGASAADGRRSRPKIPVNACSDYYTGYGPKFYAYSLKVYRSPPGAD